MDQPIETVLLVLLLSNLLKASRDVSLPSAVPKVIGKIRTKIVGPVMIIAQIATVVISSNALLVNQGSLKLTSELDVLIAVLVVSMVTI